MRCELCLCNYLLQWEIARWIVNESDAYGNGLSVAM
jgi:hypothetical protein